MNVLTDLDLKDNTLSNMVVGTRATLGVSDKAGLLATNNNKLYYNDGAWKQLSYVRSPSTTSYTLDKDDWTNNNTYVITVSGMAATDEVYLDIGSSITESAYDQLAAAKIIVLSQSSEQIVIKALGTVPTVDIPISITVV